MIKKCHQFSFDGAICCLNSRKRNSWMYASKLKAVGILSVLGDFSKEVYTLKSKDSCHLHSLSYLYNASLLKRYWKNVIRSILFCHLGLSKPPPGMFIFCDDTLCIPNLSHFYPNINELNLIESRNQEENLNNNVVAKLLHS